MALGFPASAPRAVRSKRTSCLRSAEVFATPVAEAIAVPATGGQLGGDGHSAGGYDVQELCRLALERELDQKTQECQQLQSRLQVANSMVEHMRLNLRKEKASNAPGRGPRGGEEADHRASSQWHL